MRYVLIALAIVLSLFVPADAQLMCPAPSAFCQPIPGVPVSCTAGQLVFNVPCNTLFAINGVS